MKFKGLAKGLSELSKSAKSLGLSSSSGGSHDPEAEAIKKSKGAYKSQVKKLKGLLPKRKNKHKHHSKARLVQDSDDAGDADQEEPDEPEPEQSSRKSKSRKQKKSKKKKVKGSKGGQRSSEEEAEAETKPQKKSKVKREKGKPRTPNLIGWKYQAVCTLVTLQLVTSALGLLLIPVIDLLGSPYAWNRLAPSVITLLVFLGLAASVGVISGLFLLLKRLEAIKGRAVKDFLLHILLGISLLLAFVGFIVAIFQFHDVMDIFGHRFLHLLRSYKTDQSEKMTMDHIQLDFRCCGHFSYEDWFDIESLREYGEGYVPFSCCSLHALRPCQHNEVPVMEQLAGEGRGALKDRLSIYFVGCKYHMEIYYKKLLRWPILVFAALLFIQVFLSLLLELVRRSSGKKRRDGQ